MCANDRVAVGVLLACGRLRLRVPEDLSIVGYDDDEPLAATSVPALTTIALPHREMGELAINLLLQELGEASAGSVPAPLGQVGPDHAVPDHAVSDQLRGPILLPCPVVSRGSVAAPAR